MGGRPGCNVNHPVQAWVWPGVNEAKTRLSGKSSQWEENENKRWRRGKGARETRIGLHRVAAAGWYGA